MNRLFRLALALLGCLFLAACGDDDKSGDGPLTGGERLAWNQQAASVQELRSLTYRLYVDGTLSAFTDVRCAETLTDGGYECSGGLPAMTPGRHSLQISSVLNGVESAKSEPLVIEVAGTTRRSAPASESPLSDSRPRAPATACIETSADACYGIAVVADSIGAAHSLRSTPDGRLFFIEDGSRVRVVQGDKLLAEPALTLGDPDSRIVGLAVDSQFTRTRSVFIAWTEIDRAGDSRLNVTRYRELAGIFGEGAQILTGLELGAGSTGRSIKQDPPYVLTEQDPAYVANATPMAEKQDAPHIGIPMAVDGEGLLYVAMPAAADARATLSPSGTILRFTRDGLVPRGNRLSWPVVSEGYARPTGLAIDASLARVWMTGSDPALRNSVASFTFAPNSTSSMSMRAASSDETLFNDSVTVGSITLAATNSTRRSELVC